MDALISRKHLCRFLFMPGEWEMRIFSCHSGTKYRKSSSTTKGFSSRGQSLRRMPIRCGIGVIAYTFVTPGMKDEDLKASKNQQMPAVKGFSRKTSESI